MSRVVHQNTTRAAHIRQRNAEEKLGKSQASLKLSYIFITLFQFIVKSILFCVTLYADIFNFLVTLCKQIGTHSRVAGTKMTTIDKFSK